jgi:2-polyprenyl-3-methyl-5-hydroxy-6-metoxy-1,4-benzoquinol methylase
MISQDVLPCWCGSGGWSTRVRARRFGVLECSGCGGYRIDPPPLCSGGGSAEFYTEYYRTVGTEAVAIQTPATSRSAGFWKVAERFEAVGEVRQRVVDIGCGDGHLCAELKAEGWPFVAGFEVSQTRIGRARKLYPDLTFFDQTLAESGLEKQSLDLIVMEAVIEHLPEPVELLGEFLDFLSPGGRVVLTTPNMDSGAFRLLGRRWTGMLAPHAHIFLFSPSSIQRLLKEAGFVAECAGSYHTPMYGPLDYLRRLARGDLKGTVWRAHQELGSMYGRLIHAGPMLFAVGRKPQ